jgi:hypothetical protein
MVLARSPFHYFGAGELFGLTYDVKVGVYPDWVGI